MGHNGQNFRASGKESEHSIIGKIKSLMCIGLSRREDLTVTNIKMCIV